MPAEVRAQIKTRFKNAMESQSNDPNKDPEAARNTMAEEFADAVFASMIGREVTVQGVTSDGATFQATGLIIE